MGPQGFLGYSEDVVGCDGSIAFHVGVDSAWVAGEDVEEVQLIGSASESSDAFQAADVVGLILVERHLDFAVGRRVVVEAFELCVDDFFDLVEVLSWVCGDLDDELSGDFAGVVFYRYVSGDSPVVDEALVEAGALSFAHDDGEDVEGRFVGSEYGACRPDDG